MNISKIKIILMLIMLISIAIVFVKIQNHILSFSIGYIVAFIIVEINKNYKGE